MEWRFPHGDHPNTLFKEFNDLYPNKIVNVTNGVTPRRWVAQANPLLSHYLTKHLKEHKIAESEHEWLSNMQLLTSLVEPLSKDSHAIAELWRSRGITSNAWQTTSRGM